jgi:hypothetical protein
MKPGDFSVCPFRPSTQIQITTGPNRKLQQDRPQLQNDYSQDRNPFAAQSQKPVSENEPRRLRCAAIPPPSLLPPLQRRCTGHTHCMASTDSCCHRSGRPTDRGAQNMARFRRFDKSPCRITAPCDGQYPGTCHPVWRCGFGLSGHKTRLSDGRARGSHTASVEMLHPTRQVLDLSHISPSGLISTSPEIASHPTI